MTLLFKLSTLYVLVALSLGLSQASFLTGYGAAGRGTQGQAEWVGTSQAGNVHFAGFTARGPLSSRQISPNTFRLGDPTNARHDTR